MFNSQSPTLHGLGISQENSMADTEPINRDLEHEVRTLRFQLEEQQNHAIHLNKALETEKKIVRELRSEKTDGTYERNELELIFLDCVNEMKK